MSWFEEDDQGHYLSGPGVSPETGFYAPDGTGPNVLSYVSNGTSHDQLLVPPQLHLRLRRAGHTDAYSG